jgi:hypothetical protein
MGTILDAGMLLAPAGLVSSSQDFPPLPAQCATCPPVTGSSACSPHPPLLPRLS